MSVEYREIPVGLIAYSPFNTRGSVDQAQIEALAATMASGNDVPIKVRPVEGEKPYEVVYGERRLRALQHAGIEYARCIVQELSDEQVLLEQWVENEEHRDIPDYGKALKLRQLLDSTKLSQRELGKRLGKDGAWINHHLSMLQLEGVVPGQHLWQISERQARAILSAPDDLLKDIAKEVEYYAEIRGGELPSAYDIEKMVFAAKNQRLLDKGRETQDHQHVYEKGSSTCKICGRPLSDPNSVKAGVGPVCASGPKAETPSGPFTPNPLRSDRAGLQSGAPTLEERGRPVVERLRKQFTNPSQAFTRSSLMYNLQLDYDQAERLASKLLKEPVEEKPILPPERLVELEGTAMLEAGEEPEGVELTIDILVTNKEGVTTPQEVSITVPYGGRLSINVDGAEVFTRTEEAQP